MALSNTAAPKYYGQFRDAVIRGEIPVNREISMEMNRIDDQLLLEGKQYLLEDKRKKRLKHGGEVMNQNELYHTGRKGMKWGEHIFGKVKDTTSRVKNRAIYEGQRAYDTAKRSYSSAKEITNRKYGRTDVSPEEKRRVLKELTKSYIQQDRYRNSDRNTDKYFDDNDNFINRTRERISAYKKASRNEDMFKLQTRRVQDYINAGEYYFGEHSNFGSLNYKSTSGYQRNYQTGKEFVSQFLKEYM